MRSVSSSACFISSNDSARVYFASLVQPQFSCIFACRKYWLIAVSSAVSCSFKNSMTRASPCMFGRVRGFSPVLAENGHRARVFGVDQIRDAVQARAAAGARGAFIADGVLGAGAGLNDPADLALANSMADADIHRRTPRLALPKQGLHNLCQETSPEQAFSSPVIRTNAAVDAARPQPGAQRSSASSPGWRPATRPAAPGRPPRRSGHARTPAEAPRSAPRTRAARRPTRH